MHLEQVSNHCYAVLSAKRTLYHVNSGFINLGGGVVIDTQSDLAHAQQMIALLSDVWSGRPQRVVNTHQNGDHVYGNQLFTDAEIIGHRLTAENMMHEDPARVERLRNTTWIPFIPHLTSVGRQLNHDFDFSGIKLTPPTTTFEDRMELDLNGTRVHIIHVGPAHTPSDTIVHFPEERVVFAGDLVFRLCTPIVWSGSYENWFHALDMLIELDPEVIVPGHGPLCGVEGSKELKAYLKYVLDESKAHFEAGLSSLDAAKRIDLGPYADWTAPSRLYINVERAYREFRGERPESPWNFAQVFRCAYQLARSWSIAPEL